jgi:hypothetical protein
VLSVPIGIAFDLKKALTHANCPARIRLPQRSVISVQARSVYTLAHTRPPILSL